MIYVQTSERGTDEYPAAGWHIDERGFLHIRKMKESGNAASYSPNAWTAVSESTPEQDAPRTKNLLTKTVRVCDRDLDVVGLVADSVVFAQRDDDEADGCSDYRDGQVRTIVEITADTYLDLGSPEQLTVTIEPGDLLNAGD